MSTHSQKGDRIMNESKAKKTSILRLLISSVGTVLCILFGALVICNIIIIIKSAFKPNVPPSLFGVVPLIVKSGSMSGRALDHIEKDDLIFVYKVKSEDLKVGDIIAYLTEDRYIVTHRIVSIENDGSVAYFFTKGDANNTIDDIPVTEKNVIGVFKGRIPRLGKYVLFLQSPIGIFLSVGIPVIIFFLIEILCRRRNVNEINTQ